MMQDIERPKKSATQTIVEAWKSGRPIVPFFGAGISVGAGFPLTAELREYFCKVLFYIRKGGYRLSLGQSIALQPAVTDPENNPSKFLETYGWPDFFRINAELLHIRSQMANNSGKPPSAWDSLLFKTANPKADTFTTAITELLNSNYDTQRLQIQEFNGNGIASLLNPVSQDAFAKNTGLARWINGRHLLDRKMANDFADGLAWFRRFEAGKLKPETDSELRSYQQEFKKLQRLVAYARACVCGWGNGQHWLSAIVESEILELMKLEDSERVRLLESSVWARELTNRIDWFRLLLELVEGRMGLADLLFATLNRDRMPSAAHITIAHVASRMGWPLILTLNHDTLLEEAFRAEKLPHKVFDVSKDANVPDRVVVTSELLSIVKLHGSAFGLKLGEPTNLELDTQTKLELQKYIPPRALIVVAGFSGYERRMMSLIESFCLSGDAPGKSASDSDSPRIVWLHQESESGLPQPIRILEEKLTRMGDGIDGPKCLRMVRNQIQDAGRFFLGLYQSMVLKLPRTRIAYDALPKRIFLSEDVQVAVPTGDDKKLQHIDYPDSNDPKLRDLSRISGIIKRHLFHRPPENAERGHLDHNVNFDTFNSYWDCFAQVSKSETNHSPSLRMSQFVQSSLTNYRVIWIDLEDHHTISGIVTEIADRMRVHDPSIPPLLLPVEEHSPPMQPKEKTKSVVPTQKFSRAVRYLKRYLRRGKYAIALDSVEGFGRNHLSHHGYIRFKKKGDGTIEDSAPFRRINDLTQFLKELLSDTSDSARDKTVDETRLATEPDDIGCSVVCASIDIPTSRHTQSQERNPLLDVTYKLCMNQLVTIFKGQAGQPVGGVPREAEDKKGTDAAKTFSNEDILDRNTGELLAQAVASLGSEDKLSMQDRNDRIDFIVFQILVTFRRPRSLASIHWVVNRYFAVVEGYKRGHDKVSTESDAVDPALASIECDHCGMIGQSIERLKERRLVFEMEGQYFWIEHSTHEAAYEVLTKPFWLAAQASLTQLAWERAAQEGLRQAFGKSFVTDLTSCFTVVAWNSMISRYYYIHAFQRSQDVNALFEYLYHRVSSLRYIQIARGFVARQIASESTEPMHLENSPALKFCLCLLFNSQLSDLNESEREFGDQLLADEPAATPPTATLSSPECLHWLLNLIDKSKSRYLRTLINVIERETPVMFRTASADTWLDWLKSIQDALNEMVTTDENQNVIWSTFVSNPISQADRQENPLTGPQSEFQHLHFQLKLVLLDLRSRLHREKGNYEECKKCRETLLNELDPTEHWREVQKKSDAAVGNVESLAINPLADASQLAEIVYNTSVDMISCWRREQVGRIGSEKYLRVHGVDCGERDLAEQDWRQYAKCNEARFAYRVLPGLFEDSSGQRLQWGSLIRTRVHLEWLRMQIDDLDPWTGDRHQLEKHKADLSMIESRIYGSAFRHESEFSVVLAELFGLRGQIQMLSGDYAVAMSSLMEALSGLSEDDESQQFHIAAIRRRYAHCLMRIADKELQKTQACRDRSKLDFALGRLKEASTEISHVESLLRKGRRNVRAWKHLYRAKVQLSIEYMLCYIQRFWLPNHGVEDSQMFSGVVRTQMEIALDGIRGGLDCTLRHELASERGIDNQIRFETEDLIAKWLQLFLLGSICYELEASDQVSPYLSRWESVNDSTGIHRLTNIWRTTKVKWCEKQTSDVQGTRCTSEILGKESLNVSVLSRWNALLKDFSAEIKASKAENFYIERTLLNDKMCWIVGSSRAAPEQKRTDSQHKLTFDGNKSVVQILSDKLLHAKPPKREECALPTGAKTSRRNKK